MLLAKVTLYRTRLLMIHLHGYTTIQSTPNEAGLETILKAKCSGVSLLGILVSAACGADLAGVSDAVHLQRDESTAAFVIAQQRPAGA